jgi:hypothetical protein
VSIFDLIGLRVGVVITARVVMYFYFAEVGAGA